MNEMNRIKFSLDKETYKHAIVNFIENNYPDENMNNSNVCC